MTKVAAVYCRISRDRVGAGLGVERQEEDCRELAERLGWRVAAVYRDNDLSAYSGKPRPEYLRLLADVEAGRVGAVVVWHADRLHRSPVELERWIATCDPRDVPTMTVRAGPLDLSTANGRMVARITGAVSRHESEQRGERVRRQKQQAIADGRWVGGRRPFAFEPDGATVREPEAELIRDAARRLLAGDSARSIFREWNERGVTTSTGQPWTGSKFTQMITRPRNAGLVGTRTGGGSRYRVIGEARWPAIIEPDTWHALVELLGDPARTTHKGTSRVRVGSFLYRCECGSLVRSGGAGPRGGRYVCGNAHYKSADRVDEVVLAVVAAYLRREGVRLITPVADVAPLRERLAVLTARAEEIASAFADPDTGMTGAQFKIANEKVQRQVTEVTAEIARRTSGSALAGVADAPDPGAAFLAADIDRQRVITGELFTVTLHRGEPGRRFDPETVVVRERPS